MSGSEASCGNPNHPDGPWHDATPIPGTWERAATRLYEARRATWGCGCAAKVEAYVPPRTRLQHLGDRIYDGHLVRKERRAKAKRERDRLSGYNPRTGVYEKGGLRPRNGPPPPVGTDRIPPPPRAS